MKTLEQMYEDWFFAPLDKEEDERDEQEEFDRRSDMEYDGRYK